MGRVRVHPGKEHASQKEGSRIKVSPGSGQLWLGDAYAGWSLGPRLANREYWVEFLILRMLGFQVGTKPNSVSCVDHTTIRGEK